MSQLDIAALLWFFAMLLAFEATAIIGPIARHSLTHSAQLQLRREFISRASGILHDIRPAD